MTNKVRWKRWLIRAALVLPVCVLLSIVFRDRIILFAWHVLPFMGQEFTSEAWAEGGSCHGLTDFQCQEKASTCPRGPMVRSLIRKHLVPGTRREKVMSMLGPNDGFENRYGEGGTPDRSCPTWELGMCSGLRIDYDVPTVCFDPSGYLIRAGHYQS